MKGYEEAFRSDLKTNKLLEENPITKDNIIEWMKYARTIKTTMDIILAECKSITRELK